MRVVAVDAVGTKRVPAFVKRAAGCSLENVEVSVFPDSPRGQALRDARVAAGMSLRELARRLELTPVDLSAVERGRATFEDDASWQMALAGVAPSPNRGEGGDRG